MKHASLAALCGATLLTLAGCGGTDSSTDADASPAAAENSTQADALDISDPWVKAADSGMTAGFGTLSNSSDSDVVVTAAESPAAPMVELHEVVDGDGGMAMQPVEGGFTVPAGGELVLEPGGYHLMLMDLAEPIEPGATVEFTLTMGDGSTTEVESTVKRFTGADESYRSGSDGDAHSGHDDSSHEAE